MEGRITLALALLTAPALAGCIQGAQAATAEERADPASEAAETWADDAELAAATGMEGEVSDGHGRAEADHWDRARDDEDIGDGRCKVWQYTFVAESKPDEVYVVAVDEDEEILSEQTRPRSDPDVALGSWEIDSDEALGIARDANEHLAEGIDGGNYGLLIELDRDPDDENPTWFVAGGGGDSSGGSGGIVLLDAVTGDVLESSGGSSDGYDRDWR